MCTLCSDLLLMRPENWYKDSWPKTLIPITKMLSATTIRDAGQKTVEWDSWSMMLIWEELFSGKLRTECPGALLPFTGKIPLYLFTQKIIQICSFQCADLKSEFFLKSEHSRKNLLSSKVSGNCRMKWPKKSLQVPLFELMMNPSKDSKTECVRS